MNETPVRYDATTPRVDRRAFLKLGVAGGAGALVAACGWDGGNAIRPNLLAVSRLNDWVGEKILRSPTRLARTYSPAERSRRLPSYFISATTPMLKGPRLWRLRVDGLVDRTLELSIEDLMRMPRVTYAVKHHCVEGWSGVATWHGVPVWAVVERCVPRAGARCLEGVACVGGSSQGRDGASAPPP